MTEELIRKAVEMWNAGIALGEIAARLNVGLYDVTFLTRAARRALRSNPDHPQDAPLLLDIETVLEMFE